MQDSKKDFELFLNRSTTANVIPVVETMTADLLTPLAVYLKISKDSENSFLLESVEGGENLARFSFIGANPALIVSGNDIHIATEKDGIRETLETSLFEFLRTRFAETRLAESNDLPAFIGGAIGYFGFGCAEWFEKSLKTEEKSSDSDDACLMFFHRIIAFDHVKQVIKIISLVFTGEAVNDTELENLYRKATSENINLKKVLETAPINLPENKGPEFKSLEITSNQTRKDFEDAVCKIKDMISAGECYQTVLSQCFTRKTSADAVSVYRALRSLNPSPYMFLLKINRKSIIGASPETLIKCTGKNLEYRPIAGTRRRGKNSSEDEQTAAEMLKDEKEIAEHLMLVDLGRNDLGRIAEYGSVKIERLMAVEKFSHVQHIVSYLAATLKEGFDCFDALAACFPAGTVSGAPKIRAMQIIKKLEPTKRGIYAGAVGYIDYSGNLDTCIAIRTLVLENGEAKIQAGAGIVADSVPEREFEETVNKAEVLLKAVEIAESQF